MEIKNCLIADAREISSLYESARNLQIHRKMVVWASFEDTFIINEIKEERQWKIVSKNVIVCNWEINLKTKKFGVR